MSMPVAASCRSRASSRSASRLVEAVRFTLRRRPVSGSRPISTVTSQLRPRLRIAMAASLNEAGG